MSHNNKVSICIPRMETTTTKEYIQSIFNKLNIGYIERMNEIPLRNDASYKRIIITLNLNDLKPSALKFKQLLEKNEPIKLVHSMPWYWKIVATSPQK